MANILRKQAKSQEAVSLLHESLQLGREMVSKPEIAKGLLELAFIAANHQQAVRAVKLFAASQALRQVVGMSLKSREQNECNREVGTLRATMPKADFEDAWREGWRLPLDAAIDYALSQD